MDKVSFSLDDAKIKLTERSRGRMKIQIKFSKEEAEGFKTFAKIKPEQLSDEEFYKQIFFAGCNAMTEQIQKMIKEHQKSEEQKLDSEESVNTNEQEEE
tara:strand:- start:2863 stop:3159 length:297 start_codon:yes stop_codon:yes gene_type:complete